MENETIIRRATLFKDKALLGIVTDPGSMGQHKLKSVMTTGCGFKTNPLADEHLIAAEVGVEAEELVLGQPRAFADGTARLARLHPMHLVTGQLRLWLWLRLRLRLWLRFWLWVWLWLRLWLWLWLWLLTIIAGRLRLT